MNHPSSAAPANPEHYGSGSVIDRKYRLVRQIGHGAMGVVWVAHNEVLQVHVAIKLMRLRREGPEPETLAARLLTEARAAAQLAHPAICRVFDFGETEFGDPFVVQELLHGETVADVLAREKRLSAIEAVQLVLPVAEGLAAAHGKGIVHRDVKPENIFISRDETTRLQPKLLDFGIARLAEVETKLTIAGTLLGTPDYMSPEQARGEERIDARSDIWSLSVVLYELLTGHLPFERDNYNALLFAIVHDPPPPVLQYGAGDEVLWAALARGLSKSPEERWQSMREFGVALARWLYQSEVREDLCGASIRKTWLEPELASDQAAFLSTRPPVSRALGAGGPMAPAKSSRRGAAAIEATTSSEARETAAGTSLTPRMATTEASIRRKRGRRLVVVAAASVLLGAGAGTAVLVSTSAGSWVQPNPSAGSSGRGEAATQPEAAGFKPSSAAAPRTLPAPQTVSSASPSSSTQAPRPPDSAADSDPSLDAGAHRQPKHYVRPRPGRLRKPTVPKDDYEFGF